MLKSCCYLLKIMIFKTHAPKYNCHIIADISGWGNFGEWSFFNFSSYLRKKKIMPNEEMSN